MRINNDFLLRDIPDSEEDGDGIKWEKIKRFDSDIFKHEEIPDTVLDSCFGPFMKGEYPHKRLSV